MRNKKICKKSAKSDRLQFTFGSPEPMMDKSEILQYFESVAMHQRWYEPPLNWSGLAKSYRSASHHSSAIQTKRNLWQSTLQIDEKMLSRTEMAKFLLDFLVFGNAYLEVQRDRAGRPLALTAPKAKYVRKGVEAGKYFYLVNGWETEHEFAHGSVFHLLEPDINQDVYGLPEYLSALQSAWLNESATLFRRKYYVNGAHAGFILQVTDPLASEEDVKNLREMFEKAKGIGNFKNILLYQPSGKKDGLNLIPIADVAAKDEFLNIKNVSRDDILAAHRVPPQLMGIIPNNTGGFGDVEKAAQVFFLNEIEPLQQRLLEINHWLGQEVIRIVPSKLFGMNAAKAK